MTHVQIPRSRSGKAFAIGRGTFVVLCTNDPPEGATLLELAIGDTDALRQRGPVTARRDGTILELRVDVEYGPVRGAYESDLQRQLRALTIPLKTISAEVFSFRRKELITQADLDEVLPALEQEVEDLHVSLRARKHLSDLITKVRESMPSSSE